MPWKYWLPLHTVYTGISTQVNGMAVDWLSASIYWTDALYNWITVARLRSQDIFNHIVTTQLDRPMGLAVYPQNGYNNNNNNNTEGIIIIVIIITDLYNVFRSEDTEARQLMHAVRQQSGNCMARGLKRRGLTPFRDNSEMISKGGRSPMCTPFEIISELFLSRTVIQSMAGY